MSDVKKTDTKKDESKKTKKKVDETKVKKTSEKKKSVKKNDVSKPVKNVVKKKTETITLEEADSFYHVSLLTQAVCVIGVLAISILAIFEHSFTVPIEVLVGITLLVMAYNNMKLFKRKGMTIIYVIFGLISFVVGICGYFGVN